MRTHTGEQHHDCSVCGKRFNLLIHLKRHMRTHTGDKPYDCDVCGKGFGLPENLQIHMEHIQVINLMTVIYVKGFSKLINLKRHMRIHTGDNPYDCDVYCKGFIEQDKLQNQNRHRL